MIEDAALRERIGEVSRTIDTIVPEVELLAKLETGRPLRVKWGIDPTSTSVHIGNAIQLWILRALQEGGHRPVLILGDYTATVGDPSGKDKTRPMLTPEQIETNMETWMQQIGMVLDLDRVEVRRNSEWFAPMSFLDVLGLADRMTVQQMMERDSFEDRWAANEPISVREFLYCLMQGWDSVAVKADVELGGNDQTFNLMVARRFMTQEGLPPQVNVLTPLLEGTDGQAKMSKSLGNSINLLDSPKDKFGMAMRVSDDLMGKYLRLVTGLSDEAILALEALENPRDAKLGLAEALVARYHGAGAGRAEREEFLRVFSQRDAPTDIPDVALGDAGDDGSYWIVDVLKTCGFATSTSEARRLVQGGGVRLDEAKIADWQARLALEGGEVLRVGRRRYARLAPPGNANP